MESQVLRKFMVTVYGITMTIGRRQTINLANVMTALLVVFPLPSASGVQVRTILTI